MIWHGTHGIAQKKILQEDSETVGTEQETVVQWRAPARQSGVAGMAQTTRDVPTLYQTPSLQFQFPVHGELGLAKFFIK